MLPLSWKIVIPYETLISGHTTGTVFLYKLALLGNYILSLFLPSTTSHHAQHYRWISESPPHPTLPPSSLAVRDTRKKDVLSPSFAFPLTPLPLSLSLPPHPLSLSPCILYHCNASWKSRLSSISGWKTLQYDTICPDVFCDQIRDTAWRICM